MSLEDSIEKAKECFTEMIRVCPDLDPEFVILDIAEDFVPVLPSESLEFGYDKDADKKLIKYHEEIVEALWSVWEKSRYEVD